MEKVCSKCNLSKPIEEFDSYFHSTQNKIRVRGYCKTCFRKQKMKYRESIRKENIIQPEVPELQPEVSEVIPGVNKRCSMCEQVIPLENYYQKDGRLHFAHCKECERKRVRKAREEKLIENGGSDVIGMFPGDYKDKYQEEQTTSFLTLLGWKINPETKTWYNNKFKMEDGSWVGLRPRKKKVRIRGKHKVQRPLKLNAIQLDEVVFLRKKNYSFAKIAELYNVSAPTIKTYIDKIVNKNN